MDLASFFFILGDIYKSIWEVQDRQVPTCL